MIHSYINITLTITILSLYLYLYLTDLAAFYNVISHAPKDERLFFFKLDEQLDRISRFYNGKGKNSCVEKKNKMKGMREKGKSIYVVL